jgi:hypothetical protein
VNHGWYRYQLYLSNDWQWSRSLVVDIFVCQRHAPHNAADVHISCLNLMKHIDTWNAESRNDPLHLSLHQLIASVTCGPIQGCRFETYNCDD